MSEALTRLKVLLGEIYDLERVGFLLGWDQETTMPPEGAAARAEQRATIGRAAHERLVSDELGRLLEQLRGEEESLPYESDEASLVRVARHDHEKACRVPTELRAEILHAGALGLGAWLEARERRDFDVLRPHVERLLELKRRYIECFEPVGDPYDVLLDDYERGFTTAETESVLEHLKRELVPLVEAAREADGDEPPLVGPFPVEGQRAFSLDLLERLGYDRRSWRLDHSEHPFTANLAIADIRLTSHFRETHLGGIFAAVHEFGHGLYERQIAPSLGRTPLAGGASAALHESQSRMWENLVGRGRAFWVFAYDDLRAALPEALADVDLDRFFRAVNRIRPSLTRVDADEITYNLHIVLRFELERELLAGRLEVRDLPAAFDERMHSYLGLDVPDARAGVLQDIHWADATFGYFPTYSLGNVMSVQIWEKACADLGDLDGKIARGEFEALREWLREHLHRHGRKFTPRETLLRAAGSEIDPEPYVRYLKGKLGEVAGVAVS
jgi:carboxypeptidase Taq